MTDNQQREALLPDNCPFCGARPKIRQGKTTHCQLHGEPSASAIVYCDNHLCKAKPQIAAGDCYQSGGYKAAIFEAMTAWDTRAHPHQEAKVDEDTAIRAMWSINFGHSLMQYTEDAKRGVDSSDHVRRAAYQALRPYLHSPSPSKENALPCEAPKVLASGDVVDRIAIALWKDESARAAYRLRIGAMFYDQSPEIQELWRRSAKVALAAMQEGI